MHKDNWDDIRFVLAVAETGTVSAAARALGVNHATVLRRISAFEEANGTVIFDRTPTGYTIPPERLRVIDAIREVHNAIQSVTRIIEGAEAQLTGVVRITSTDTLCTTVLPDVIAHLMADEPGLRIELIASNAHTDLGRLHADISVRPAIKLPEDLIGEQAGLLRMRAYAPVGMPDAPWLGMKGSISRSLVAEWIAQRTKSYGPSNGADSFLVLKEMVASGMGKSVLPDCIALRDHRIMPVDVPEVDVNVPIWVATHHELATAPRLRSVRQKLIGLIADHPFIAGRAET